MAEYSIGRIREIFQRGDVATTSIDKGHALEDLICYIFENVPGVEITERDIMNVDHTDEIDIVLWNDGLQEGLYFLPNIMIIECKNHSDPVDTRDVVFFIDKVEDRGLDFGILVAANGITGSKNSLDRSHSKISKALSRRTRIIVITREEIERLTVTNDLIILIKRKLCQLHATGSVCLRT